MPGVPNASIARQVERAGFDAVYISGAGLANCTAGLPDIGLLTLTEVAMLAGFIAKTVKIPAIVDAGHRLTSLPAPTRFFRKRCKRNRSFAISPRKWRSRCWRI